MNKLIFLFAFLLFGTGCKTRQASMKLFPDFYQEGHRGTRGLMPENTIPAMKKGIEVGANVIEVDVYTTKDGKVVVAHDPYINREHSLLPNGEEIPEADATRYILHQMNYDKIKAFDTGSKYYPLFPQQKKISTYSPLLSELIDSVEHYTKAHHLPDVIYNIELKNSLKYDEVYNATPPVLVDAVMDIVKGKNIKGRYYLQSFDVRPLQYIHENYPKVVVGFLTSSKNSFEQNVKEIGFYPDIYSPHFSLATEELIEKCHSHKIKFIPWTVQTLADMKEMKALGVDGIITDYPNLFAELKINQ